MCYNIAKKSLPSELLSAMLRMRAGDDVSEDLASNIMWATLQARGTKREKKKKEGPLVMSRL
jgi:hypothetical protein